MAITVVGGGVAVGAAGEGATSSISKGTDRARLDIRGWALDATDPAIRIEIRRFLDIGKLSLRFRFQEAFDPKGSASVKRRPAFRRIGRARLSTVACGV
jgi:hypothetical protein